MCHQDRHLAGLPIPVPFSLPSLSLKFLAPALLFYVFSLELPAPLLPPASSRGLRFPGLQVLSVLPGLILQPSMHPMSAGRFQGPYVKSSFFASGFPLRVSPRRHYLTLVLKHLGSDGETTISTEASSFMLALEARTQRYLLPSQEIFYRVAPGEASKIDLMKLLRIQSEHRG